MSQTRVEKNYYFYICWDSEPRKKIPYFKVLIQTPYGNTNARTGESYMANYLHYKRHNAMDEIIKQGWNL